MRFSAELSVKGLCGFFLLLFDLQAALGIHSQASKPAQACLLFVFTIYEIYSLKSL